MNFRSIYTKIQPIERSYSVSFHCKVVSNMITKNIVRVVYILQFNFKFKLKTFYTIAKVHIIIKAS